MVKTNHLLGKYHTAKCARVPTHTPARAHTHARSHAHTAIHRKLVSGDDYAFDTLPAVY